MILQSNSQLIDESLVNLSNAVKPWDRVQCDQIFVLPFLYFY